MTRPIVYLLAALLAVAAPAAVQAQAEGERLCRSAATPRDGRPAPTGPYTIDDRFGERTLEAGAPALLCRASQRVIGPGAVLPTIAAFRAQGPRSETHAAGERLVVHTRFGSMRLRVKAPSLLAFEVATGAPPSPAPVACYAVKARRRQRLVATVIVDQREEVLRIGAPRRLCVDVDAEGTEHLCLQARRIEGEKDSAAVDVTTALGPQTLAVGEPVELCVPVIADGPPPPPPPPFTLRIHPASLEMQPGETGPLTVAAFFAEGGSEDRSDQVTWVSSDQTVAVVHTSAGGAFVTAGVRGTATISAVDPESGISSADSGGNAEITVVWPLEKLTISPPVVRKKVGESEEYTVTGHFTGGTTMNLTQRVTYWSNSPAVASAPNTPGHRSRVHALAPGVATIRATDPNSGISTTDSANDAVLRVGGGVPYIGIVPERNGRLVVRLGQTEQLTAVASYPDGSTKNRTQQCVWSSEDQWAPGGGPVVLTPNADGDRSRIEAAATGTAWVTCLDPESGRTGYLVVDVVSDQLISLGLLNGQWPPLRNGVSRSVTAIGAFAPFEPNLYPWDTRGTLNLTQDVTYVSRDPDIAIATNEAGDRSRIVGVSPGVARIYAFDPASGIESPDHHMVSLGRLVGIMLNSPPWSTSSRALLMPEGTRRVFTVRGIYEGGVLKLSTFEPDSFLLDVADPAIVRIAPDWPAAIDALAGGRTTVTVRHLATGFVSEPFEVTVKGELSAIELEPRQVTRALGDEFQFTAFGLFPPDFRESLTQRFEYRSSDPSVAVVANEPYRRSLVRMVGSGTAVISAFDPLTGITSSDTGGDAVVEVLPGAIERVTVEPIDVVLPVYGFKDFTAIGHYPDGRTINVTKQVQWNVTDASVASAPSAVGGNSRIQGIAPGTTRVVATHLSGVSSTETDDDARLTVRPLVAVTLTPATRTAKAGTTIRYTASGTLDDGTPVNLTQRAWYWIEPWEAASVPNDDDDRSRFDLLLPGPATVHAEVDGWPLSAELTIEP